MGDTPRGDAPPSIFDLLEEIRSLVLAAKTVPLSSSVLVPRDELIRLVEAAIASVPEEVSGARWLLREREEFLARTRLEAADLLDEARARVETLVANTEVIRAANSRANHLVNDARDQAARMRMQTEDFIDQRLASFEIVLSEVLEITRRGRSRLMHAPMPQVMAEEEANPFERGLEEG